jgi:hypothetical protein
MHCWGECVITTGFEAFSDATDPTDHNKWYDNKFSALSSASPFVAAAIANIQGIAMKNCGFPPLHPKEMCKLLTMCVLTCPLGWWDRFQY